MVRDLAGKSGVTWLAHQVTRVCFSPPPDHLRGASLLASKNDCSGRETETQRTRICVAKRTLPLLVGLGTISAGTSSSSRYSGGRFMVVRSMGEIHKIPSDSWKCTWHEMEKTRRNSFRHPHHPQPRLIGLAGRFPSNWRLGRWGGFFLLCCAAALRIQFPPVVPKRSWALNLMILPRHFLES